MFSELQFAYLVGDLLFGCAWLLLFLRRKDVRREMLFIGSVMGAIALVVAPLFYDYWKPEYLHPFGLEEFLYGFFAGGIASVLYEELYGKHFSRRHTRKHHWPLLLIASFFVGGIAFLYLLHVGVLSVYASGVLLFLCGAWMLLFRKDLVSDAIASGMLFTILTSILFWIYIFLFPTVIYAWWNVEVLTFIPGIGYPLEELAWAFCLGFCAGPMYEFLAGQRFVK